MSLYNAIFGYHPYAGLFLKALGVHPGQIPRFRDCFVEGEDIVIYTRTGGGNRQDYENRSDGPSNADLRKIPGFVCDHDDSLDSTFAWFRYRCPDTDLHKKVLELASTCGRPLPEELHKNLMADMKAGRRTQYTQRGQQVFDGIAKQMAANPGGGMITVGEDGSVEVQDVRAKPKT